MSELETIGELETIDENTKRIYFIIKPEEYKDVANNIYKKYKSRINVPGFRPGKVPFVIFKRQIGEKNFAYEIVGEMIVKILEDTEIKYDIEIIEYQNYFIDDVEANGVIHANVIAVLKPKAVVDKYVGLEYVYEEKKVEELEATEDDVNAKLEEERNKNARLIDLDDPAKLGDTVNIDYEGKINGVSFENGKANNFSITLGEKKVIEGIEDSLIGCKQGDEISQVEAKFPDDYFDKAVAGKIALFEIKVNSVSRKELPELNDEFAQEISEFDKLDDYKNSLREEIKKSKVENERVNKENKVLDVFNEYVHVELPESVVQREIENRFEQYGINRLNENDRKAISELYRAPVEKSLRIRSGLETVADKEGFEISSDELKNWAAENSRNDEKRDQLLKDLDANKLRKRYVIKSLCVRKAADFIVKNAIIKEEASNNSENENASNENKSNNENENASNKNKSNNENVNDENKNSDENKNA